MDYRTLLASLLPNAPYQRSDGPYRLVEVKGPDAAEFLHRLSTQDVLGMGDLQVGPAAFLDAKGKLQVTCLLLRRDSSFWLETHAEQADRLVALLERYHFTEKLTVALSALRPDTEEVRWAEGATKRDDRVAAGDGRIEFSFVRRGVEFHRRYGGGSAAVAAGDGTDALRPPTPLTADRAECVRMAVGLLRVGVETEPATLALEADLDDHISTTKGCYTGQEIVARIHTYGHVNRKACLLWLAPGPAITSPQALHELDDQLAVGRVLHAVPAPEQPFRLGVGYLPKDFQAPGTKLALADRSAVEVVGYPPLPDLPAQASTT